MNIHQERRLSPLEIFASIWRNRQLIGQLTKREIIGRYRGSMMGLAWSFINPILMLIVYTTFFTIVFKARWGSSPEQNNTDYAIILFVGLIIHGLFAECFNRAPGIIAQNVNYVKKVVFPLEILPLITTLSALFHAGISLLVLLFAQLLLNQSISWTLIFLPFVIFPFVLIIQGFMWFLAAVGVFVRDITHLASMFTSVLLFMSPVFYPVSILPERIQPWLILNPLTFIIEQSRIILIEAQQPDWIGLAVYYAISIVIAWSGFWFFQKTRKGFADVL